MPESHRCRGLSLPPHFQMPGTGREVVVVTPTDGRLRPSLLKHREQLVPIFTEQRLSILELHFRGGATAQLWIPSSRHKPLCALVELIPKATVISTTAVTRKKTGEKMASGPARGSGGLCQFRKRCLFHRATMNVMSILHPSFLSLKTTFQIATKTDIG